MKKQIHQTDIDHLSAIRASIGSFVRDLSSRFDERGIKVLDIGPGEHNTVRNFFKKATITTLDIDPESRCDIIADITKRNDNLIDDASFDLIICTDVLEHVKDPFMAADELRRILVLGGTLAVTTPLNFRIHGCGGFNPETTKDVHDYWRFTEHGLFHLFRFFKSVSIHPIDSDRFLFPVHYQLTAVK